MLIEPAALLVTGTATGELSRVYWTAERGFQVGTNLEAQHLPSVTKAHYVRTEGLSVWFSDGHELFVSANRVQGSWLR